MQDISFFALDSELGHRVAEQAGIAVAAHEQRWFEDGECKLRALESVRDHDVYLLASLHGDTERSVPDRLMQTLLLLGALRDAGAARLTVLLPYLCYARKDRRTKPRDPVSTRHVAALFEAVGTDRVLTLDVHNLAAFENAFRIGTDHLTAAPVLASHLLPNLSENIVVISPDVGGIKRAELFRGVLAEQLGREPGSGFMEKHRSAGVVSGERLVADVAGCDVILVDDLISSGGTLARAARACREQGAARILAAATHGVFSPEADRVLSDSELDGVVVTDTVPASRPGRRIEWEGLEVVSVAPLLADALRRLAEGGSLTELGVYP
ncbi:ribose-phosphate pyrophosphokinase [Halospina denitrificans]|uniref:ribose-phosphate diphosphokinase n=1 Tax=Halospina denitrificans TaxID=332522 RepID=A0A4R7JTT3_9GAMM|nr:ribose-phosphate pyrophosphokinase [Halospina denitrificans]TDT41741.1 ribose-phosphate pyrophosphokinase [Halospina denitrificans]